MKMILSSMPSWIFSVIIFLIILWLTLSPAPLGEEPPPFFPGADKIAHGIMFGGFTITLLFDWQRKNDWRPITANRAFYSAIVASFLGIFIEISQATMGLGRSFEYGDIIADTAGAFIFADIWIMWQKYWIERK